MINPYQIQEAAIHTGKTHWDTIVIGAGQAGLAAGYFLKQEAAKFLIIDAAERLGDSWRKRWDSLTLFSPPEYNSLPGMPMESAGPRTTKNEMANYLERYAKLFELPVRTGIRVTRLSKTVSGYEIITAGGKFTCDSVIVTTGGHQRPYIPSFASDLNKDILQLHSSEYLNPAKLPVGNILVAGAATSGIEIAVEIARSRPVMIAGKPSFILPGLTLKLGKKFHWWFISNILTINTPIGRKARPGILRGGAIFPWLLKMLDGSKVLRVPRITGVSNGYPKVADGREIPVSTIIWCTGDRPDFSWIDMNITDGTGWPLTKRGVALNAEGMYFAGMPFQFGLTSGLVGGVARDAAYVVRHLVKNQAKQDPSVLITSRTKYGTQ